MFKRSEPAKQEASRTPRTGGGFPLLASANALNIATVYRCVNLLADSVAMLPVQYMRKKGDIFVEDRSDRMHYLLNVLRMNCGDEVRLFDGSSGEYTARIEACGKKSCMLRILEKSADFRPSPDLWLLFAPVKKDKTDFIIAGATELGVSKIIPTLTKRTITERIKTERYEAQVIEACEQCRRLDVPQISDPQSLEKILETWSQDRILYFMDETGNGGDIQTVFKNASTAKAAILVGPEGGFSNEELQLLRQKNFAKAVSLGERILRAETAVHAALSCWQAICGDWK